MKHGLRKYLGLLYMTGACAWEAQLGRIWLRICFPRYWRTSYILRLYFCAKPCTTFAHRALFTLTLWSRK